MIRSFTATNKRFLWVRRLQDPGDADILERVPPRARRESISQDNAMEKLQVNLRRRKITICCLGLLASACEADPPSVYLDVVLFSYMDRPIFDVYLNRTDIGVAGPWPYSGRGTMSGVQIPLGEQKISWRLGGPAGAHRNGETVFAQNRPELREVPHGAGFLGVHIYEDNTVELVTSDHFPDLSVRGQAFDAEWLHRNRQ